MGGYQAMQGYSDKNGNQHKNVRIMLVGGGGPNQKGMQMIGGMNMPKTTKNNSSKFYGGDGGFLNQLSTPQNKQNTSFRQDGMVMGAQIGMMGGNSLGR